MANRSKPPPMSMEAHLDEERREVLALLAQTGPSRRSSSNSPFVTGTAAPIRSMLDIGDDSPRVIPSRQPPVRSMLDIGDCANVPSSSAIQSGPSSPLLEDSANPASNRQHPRSLSDSSPRRMEARPLPKVTNLNASNPYGFGLILSTSAPNSSRNRMRRVHPGPRLPEMRANKDGEPILDRGSSISPNSSVLLGSTQPPARKLEFAVSRSPFLQAGGPRAPPGTVVLDNGRFVDLNSAYRRLSDANLAMSNGSLSQLVNQRHTAGDQRGRLIKDWINECGEYEDTSDEGVSSDDELRRRSKTLREGPSSPPQAQSLLQALENERM